VAFNERRLEENASARMSMNPRHRPRRFTPADFRANLVPNYSRRRTHQGRPSSRSFCHRNERGQARTRAKAPRERGWQGLGQVLYPLPTHVHLSFKQLPIARLSLIASETASQSGYNYTRIACIGARLFAESEVIKSPYL